VGEGCRVGSTWLKSMAGIRDGISMGVGSLFDDNILREVGYGSNTFFWTDKWIDDVPLCVRFSRLFDLGENLLFQVPGE